jgi:hypothetical protein
MKKFILSVIILSFFVSGFLIGSGWERSRTKNQDARTDDKYSSASVLIDTGLEIFGFFEIPVKEGDTVVSLFDGIVLKDSSFLFSMDSYGDLGTIITSINGFENGKDGKYWQFWVNNKYSEVASDKYFISEGDSVMWKFTSSRFIQN